MITGNIEFELTVKEQVEKLRAALRRKILRIALMKSAVPMRDEVVNTAPQGGGALRKSIRIKLKLYQDMALVYIGPSTKYSRSGGKVKTGAKKGAKNTRIRPARYAHLVEFGSKRSKGYHWLKAAKANKQSQFEIVASQSIGEQIEKTLEVR